MAVSIARRVLMMIKRTSSLCVTYRAEGNPPLTLVSTPDGIMGLLGSPGDEADIPGDMH